MADKTDPLTTLHNALELYRQGVDPADIKLPEQSVFPHLIPAQPTTARRARMTGELFGRPAPRFEKHGRRVLYPLKSALDWLKEGESYTSLAEASVHGGTEV